MRHITQYELRYEGQENLTVKRELNSSWRIDAHDSQMGKCSEYRCRKDRSRPLSSHQVWDLSPDTVFALAEIVNLERVLADTKRDDVPGLRFNVKPTSFPHITGYYETSIRPSCRNRDFINFIAIYLDCFFFFHRPTAINIIRGQRSRWAISQAVLLCGPTFAFLGHLLKMRYSKMKCFLGSVAMLARAFGSLVLWVFLEHNVKYIVPETL